jgi:hypothetical protein
MDNAERSGPRQEVRRCVGRFFNSWFFLHFSHFLRFIYAGQIAQNEHGCGYVEWHDGPLPKFWSELVGGLRDDVWRLRATEHVAPPPKEEAGTEARLQALEEQLKRKIRR